MCRDPTTSTLYNCGMQEVYVHYGEDKKDSNKSKSSEGPATSRKSKESSWGKCRSRGRGWTVVVLCTREHCSQRRGLLRTTSKKRYAPPQPSGAHIPPLLCRPLAPLLPPTTSTKRPAYTGLVTTGSGGRGSHPNQRQAHDHCGQRRGGSFRGRSAGSRARAAHEEAQEAGGAKAR